MASTASIGLSDSNDLNQVRMDTLGDLLRVSMAEDEDPRAADPARILFNVTWGHLENLASPLVELTSEGQIRAGAASSFEWRGNELHLNIRDEYRTVSGIPITADDAAFSLKRIMILAKNTHGFSNDFLCGDHELGSVADDCPGIRVEGNTLILTPRRGKDFLLRMLTAMDFVVLLKSQVDPVTLSIKSFAETSGPYRLEEDANGNLMYVANKSHWHYSPQIPQAAKLIKYNQNMTLRDQESRPVFQLFTDDKTDLLINFSSDRPDLYIEAARAVPESVIVPTSDVGRVITVFTARGIKEIPTKRRIAIGKAMRDAFNPVIVTGDGASKPVEQFFAAFGDGGLDDSQLAELRKTFDRVTADTDGSGIRISLPGSMPHALRSIRTKIPNADCRMDMVDYIEGKSDGEPHVYVITTDTGWTEDLGLLSYTINMRQFFPTDLQAGQKWLSDYVEIADKAERLQRLRDLHAKALTEPWIVPIASQAYFTVSRKPWQYHGPKAFNSGALWYLRRV